MVWILIISVFAVFGLSVFFCTILFWNLGGNRAGNLIICGQNAACADMLCGLAFLQGIGVLRCRICMLDETAIGLDKELLDRFGIEIISRDAAVQWMMGAKEID